jgi:hypothetical protein
MFKFLTAPFTIFSGRNRTPENGPIRPTAYSLQPTVCAAGPSRNITQPTRLSRSRSFGCGHPAALCAITGAMGRDRAGAATARRGPVASRNGGVRGVRSGVLGSFRPLHLLALIPTQHRWPRANESHDPHRRSETKVVPLSARATAPRYGSPGGSPSVGARLPLFRLVPYWKIPRSEKKNDKPETENGKRKTGDRSGPFFISGIPFSVSGFQFPACLVPARPGQEMAPSSLYEASCSHVRPRASSTSSVCWA